MNNLIHLINTLTAEEEKEVIKTIKRKNQRGDAKNLQLFDYIRKGNIKNLDRKIYGKPSKNSFYALCNRLQENIIEVVASTSFSGETSEEMECLKLLLSCRIFFEKRLYKLAVKTLYRSEKQAKNFNLFSILNEVYHTKIQYAQFFQTETLQEIFDQANSNLIAFQNEFQLNMAYAEIEKKLRDYPLQKSQKLIEQVLSKFSIHKEQSFTIKSIYQLLVILSKSAKQQIDYYSILDYAHQLYLISQKQIHLKEKHKHYYLQVLSLMANIFFRTQNFEKSLDLIKESENEIRNTKHNSFYIEDLLLLKSLNFLCTEKLDQAIVLLENTSNNNLKLSLAACHIFKKDYRNAQKLLLSFNHTDQWYEQKLDLIWVLKKNIIQLIVYIEMDNVDLVYAHFESIKKRYRKKLEENGEARIIEFLNLVKTNYDYPEISENQKLNHQLSVFISENSNTQIDPLLLGFYAWIKAKIEHKNHYDEFIRLLK
ncbi:hypothetical protein [Mesonia sp. K7]|uniref:hypothetical protein n=1 Tax=Mesonia sp. K7 TaxID=2218606 RepID=UPI000DA89BBD|nr:hypothetical protein [Mesonia sp. K7]PZD76506.1 hypothetical protein DNG35_11855 [Mesonia sp. K7]